MENKQLFQFNNLSRFNQVICGVSKRQLGNMSFFKNGTVVKNRQEFCSILGIDLNNLVVPNLVHGNNIKLVTKADIGKGALTKQTAIGNYDGLITKDKNVFLMITMADCVPVVFYDPRKQLVGVAHAGWKGTLGEISRKMITKFTQLGSNPAEIMVGIGPAICGNCYEVQPDVANLFTRKFPNSIQTRAGRLYLDLKQLNFKQLIASGVQAANIELSTSCTKCNNNIFSSYRASRGKDPIMGVIIGRY